MNECAFRINLVQRVTGFFESGQEPAAGLCTMQIDRPVHYVDKQHSSGLLVDGKEMPAEGKT